MCREYKLACLNWCYQLLHCFDGKLYLVHRWKMFIISAESNMRVWNQASHDDMIQKLDHLAGGVCWCTVLLEGVKVKLSPEVCESDRFGRFLWLQWWNINSLLSVNRMKFTIKAGQLFSNCQRRLWQAHVCTHGTLWRQHYIMTSKECLTKSHILSKYSALVFLQLHLVKISRKLIIIWVNYGRKKRMPFMKDCVLVICSLLWNSPEELICCITHFENRVLDCSYPGTQTPF